MCSPATCQNCGKATYTGCGQHVDQVLRSVARADRCACPPDQRRTGGFLSRLFGR